MFIELEEVEIWYTTALDGLRHLEKTIHARENNFLSAKTLDAIHGMTMIEWKEFLSERESEHEMFASLALLASFEGTIRRDATSRGSNDQAQFSPKFRNILTQNHITISKIFDAWDSALEKNHVLRKQITTLRSLYGDRNILAHGKAHREQFVFELILNKLLEAKRKVKEQVKDFDRIN